VGFGLYVVKALVCICIVKALFCMQAGGGRKTQKAVVERAAAAIKVTTSRTTSVPSAPRRPGRPRGTKRGLKLEESP
jgi:hypothetical protein